MDKIKIYVLLLFFSLTISGQNLTKVTQKVISNEITDIETDPLGNILVGTKAGEIIKYDNALERQSELSFAGNSPVSSIVAWNPLKYFVFFEDIQQYLMIERFNVQPRIYDIALLTSNYVTLASPGVDHSIWLLESGVLELNKFNETSREKLISIPVSTQYDIVDPIRILSYKNVVIFQTMDSRILIVDQYGNELKTLKEHEILDFDIVEGSLFTLTTSEILISSIFDLGQEEKRIPLPSSFNLLAVQNKTNFILATENLIVHFSLQ